MASAVRQLDLVLNLKDQATKQLGKFNAALEKHQEGFQSFAAVGGAAVGAITVGLTKAISKARDFEEETNKFNVVFKEVSDEATAMATKLNDSYGLSILESKKLLSSTGDILTGFGFTGDAALELSSNVNTLAVDLASFTNAEGGAEAVSKALTAALLGEREALKTYGIAIAEADVSAELLKNGMSELTGEALRQAKAQATLEIAYRQSKNAIGDYERSSGSLTQSQVELSKNIEDMSIMIGTTFIPIVNEITQKITPIIAKVKEWTEKNPELTKKIILVTLAISGLVAVIGVLGLVAGPIMAGLGLLFSPVGLIIAGIVLAVVLLRKAWKSNFGGIQEKTQAVFQAIVGVYNTYIVPLWELMKAKLMEHKEYFIAVWDNIKQIFGGVWQAIQGIFKIVWALFSGYFKVMMSIFKGDWEGAWNAIKETFAGVWEGIKDVFGGVWEVMKGTFKLAINFIIGGINKLIRATNKIKIPKWAGGSGKAMLNMSEIPQLATGTNYVPQDMMAQLHEGEAVVPKKYNKAGAGAGTIINVNINGGTYMDRNAGQKLADLLESNLRLKVRV